MGGCALMRGSPAPMKSAPMTFSFAGGVFGPTAGCERRYATMASTSPSTKGLRGHDDQGTAALMDAFPDGADDLAIRPVLDLTGGREVRGVESSDRWAA